MKMEWPKDGPNENGMAQDGPNKGEKNQLGICKGKIIRKVQCLNWNNYLAFRRDKKIRINRPLYSQDTGCSFLTAYFGKVNRVHKPNQPTTNNNFSSNA